MRIEYQDHGEEGNAFSYIIFFFTREVGGKRGEEEGGSNSQKGSGVSDFLKLNPETEEMSEWREERMETVT